MLQDFRSVFDHFGILQIKGLKNTHSINSAQSKGVLEIKTTRLNANINVVCILLLNFKIFLDS